MIAQIIFQIFIIIALAPLLSGIMKKVKAFFQIRKGPGILQPYYDILKFLQKDSVVSTNVSWIFHAAPIVSFAAVLAAGLLIPIYITQLSLGFAGDLIAVIYLFALARFFTALASLDAGSSFGGMGGSREMFIASLVEPALMLSIFAVALNVGSTNLGFISQTVSGLGFDAMSPYQILAFVALFIIAIAETGRIPVDNPATHLELTMIHEAMILEYSGKQLAIVELGAMIKQLLIFSLLANIFFPWGIATGGAGAAEYVLALLIFVIKIIIIGITMAVVETSTAKWRLFRLPELMSISLMLSFLAIVAVIIVKGG
ncbi:MAG: Energy-conserving hydrogenase subunit echB [Candidatus Methanoperedens nitroreducens]|uniref:Energy-conserving hydrogenase subunit echB n=1 Tax=Candidatus Methanoperedens nitratireducens TaxID=1392998 RepID=A0A0N8KQ82_9EURY|nr:NADH-quinone oxidoreductase subunit H [Candidatus Methanoperedens sp. BLZ2]KAB2945045.1 MAG: formate hydrogenlyase [Candidatus Methanoperedens sp.]KPQ41410.1 MAG: Energy-conserving hydrogenase subunit echB [Candidatus Methanoperedens sp. BLZ1]MBZ0176627.1 NADH-quinone oxidoreductase subunit H [Candidatus Methanoperedens nitroreducens]MCX9080351.1 NADH-quinone oxidoreductase subunit H [Candidatus Methanoperedens sp.]